ncbi:MAG: SGNH/GDSL hydrolase family protein [Acidobacteria bacterium]|nr:SGNH/GDSL hydrolase family protein [Acidobacteriota bacterium]
MTISLAEFGVRQLFPQALIFPWQDDVEGITAPRPGVRGRYMVPGAFDVTASFSKQRFRGSRIYSKIKPDSTLRVAVLGDSFTFGYGAGDAETYPAQLEMVLRNSFSCGSQVEVINAGNGGTGTGEQALWYTTWVRQFHPDAVVLSVTANDLDDDQHKTLFHMRGSKEALPESREGIARQASTLRRLRAIVKSIPGYSWLSQHSQLLALMRNAASQAIQGYRRFSLAEVKVLESDPAALFKAEVRWLKARVQEDHGVLAIAFLPSREMFYPGVNVDKIRHKSKWITGLLEKVCRTEGIPFLDLTIPMSKQVASLPEPLYHSGLDAHPTPRGYREMAVQVGFLLKEVLGNHCKAFKPLAAY